MTPCPPGAPSWLGSSLQLSIEDAGIAPDACEERPAVLRLALTLTGAGHTARGYVDRDLRRALAAGDVVSIGVDRRGGVGISVVAGERLVCAVGAITTVPLADVTARYAPDCWRPPTVWLNTPEREAEWIRNVAAVRVPLDVRDARGVRPQPGARLSEGDLMLFEYARLRVSRPVTSLPLGQADWVEAYALESECAAIARVGACPLVAARTSAMLLAVDGFTPVD